jgi:hypothetical protein
MPQDLETAANELEEKFEGNKLHNVEVYYTRLKESLVKGVAITSRSTQQFREMGIFAR